MAETLDYKVRIDTSSLADQLQNIKNQVDQAMATYSWRTASPDPEPSAYAFPMQQYMAPLGIQAGQAVDTGAGLAAQASQNILNTSVLGFQKFSQDVQNAALMTSIGKMPTLANYGQSMMPNFGGMGAFRSGFEAMTGWDYDPHMSVTRGEYLRYAQNNFGDRALQNISDIGGKTFGAVAGGVIGEYYGGPIGNAIGTWAGEKVIGRATDWAYQGFAATVGRDYETASNIRSFTRDTSWRFLSGRFSDQEASGLADIATQAGRTTALLGQHMGGEDIQQAMQSYTNAGGFDFVHNATEFKNAMDSIIGSISQGAQTLRMSRDEYAAFHAQIANMGLAGNAQSALGLQKVVAAQALSGGYTAQELIQFGSQSAEMVRGTGINLGSAFMGGMQTLSDVSAMMQSGALSADLVAQLGGQQNVAATMGRLGYNWGQSKSGFTYLAAMQANPNFNIGASSPMGAMQTAIGGIGGNIDRFMELQGSVPDLLSKLTPEQLFLDRSAQFLNQAGWVLGATHHRMDKNNFRFYAGTQGISSTEADLMWGTGGAKVYAGERFRRQADLEAVNELPGMWDITKDFWGNIASSALGLPTIERGGLAISNFVSQTSRDISNWATWNVAGYRKDWYTPIDPDLTSQKAFWKTKGLRQNIDVNATSETFEQLSSKIIGNVKTSLRANGDPYSMGGEMSTARESWDPTTFGYGTSGELISAYLKTGEGTSERAAFETKLMSSAIKNESSIFKSPEAAGTAAGAQFVSFTNAVTANKDILLGQMAGQTLHAIGSVLAGKQLQLVGPDIATAARLQAEFHKANPNGTMDQQAWSNVLKAHVGEGDVQGLITRIMPTEGEVVSAKGGSTANQALYNMRTSPAYEKTMSAFHDIDATRAALQTKYKLKDDASSADIVAASGADAVAAQVESARYLFQIMQKGIKVYPQ